MSEKGLKVLRYPVYRIIEPLTRWLVRQGVHPNLITTLGFVVTLAAGLLYHQDHVRMAGLFVLLGGAFDVFDGRVARESGLASKFGSFYDSTLDRISEIVVFLGLASLYNTMRGDVEDVAMVYVVILALGGSLMVSYTRARAEGLGLECSVGFMQRPERIVLLGLGSLSFGLAWRGLVLDIIIIVVAVTTNLTAIQRIVWVHQRAAGVPLEDGSAGRVPALEGKGGSGHGQA
jgi:CDP-diacylglycerol--glycerol-3-phosphate 3-phosphatidyltransferase